MENTSRRIFISSMLTLIVSFFGYLTYQLLHIQKLINRISNKKIINDVDVKEGFNISDEVIIVRTAQDLKVFSSKCTHLGCRINRSEGNILICPCHGSRYDIKGNVVTGPSTKHLKQLEYKLKDKQIIIDLDEN